MFSLNAIESRIPCLRTLLDFDLAARAFIQFANKCLADHEIFRLKDEIEYHEGEGATFYSNRPPFPHLKNNKFHV